MGITLPTTTCATHNIMHALMQGRIYSPSKGAALSYSTVLQADVFKSAYKNELRKQKEGVQKFQTIQWHKATTGVNRSKEQPRAVYAAKSTGKNPISHWTIMCLYKPQIRGEHMLQNKQCLWHLNIFSCITSCRNYKILDRDNNDAR